MGLGNALMQTPALQALRQLYPEAIIDCFCTSRAAPVFQSLVGSLVNNVYVFNDANGLEVCKYNIIINSWPFNESFPLRINEDCIFIQPESNAIDNKHEIQHNMDLVKKLGWEGDTPDTIFQIDDEQKLAVEYLFKASFITNRPYITAHVGTLTEWAWGFKQWPYEKWIELFEVILERYNVDIIVVGAPAENWDEFQSALINSKNKLLDTLHIWIARPLNIELDEQRVVKVDALQATATIIKNSVLHISTDSGIAHLANALGVPLISIFGFTSRIKNSPNGNKNSVTKIIQHGDLECMAGCFESRRFVACPNPNPYTCIRDINVVKVIAEIEKSNVLEVRV